MKVIIAGSRTAGKWDVHDALAACSFTDEITVVLSGKAPGADTWGEAWARANDIPVHAYPARWEDIDFPGAVKRQRKDGTFYNALAGHWRNQEMAEAADALILVWDGISTGSQDMLQRAQAMNLRIFVHRFKAK